MCALQTSLNPVSVFDQATGHLSQQDKTLARLIRRVGPCALCANHRQSPFESLVEAVVHQQLHGKAARTILGRVKALVPNRRFPSPDDLLRLPEDSLRTAGLSRAKVAAVKDIAAKTRDGIVPTARRMIHMEDGEIVDRLITIRGVGRWTVEMLLIFKLGRMDVLPVDDFGVRKGFAITYQQQDLPRPKALLEYGERWRPFRSVAAWYLWRAVDGMNQQE